MQKIFTTLLLTGSLCAFQAHAQTVSTYIGIPNSTTDPVNPNQPQATTFSPWGMAFDNIGNFWFTESENTFASPAVYGNRLRMLKNTDGKVYVRAGDPGRVSGYYNYPGSPTSRFRGTTGIAFDNAENIYVVDQENHAIRKISKFTSVGNAQDVSTFAGAKPTANYQGVSGDLDGDSTNARFYRPCDIVFDGNNTFYVSDFENNKIKKINASTRAVTTYAGTGAADFADGAVATAKFNGPSGLAIANNKLYVADQTNMRIRVIDLATNTVSTLAGTGSFGNDDGAATTTATFKFPVDVAVAADGAVYVCEGLQAGGYIRRIASGQVTTFAGDKNGTTGTTNDVGTAARFNDPRSLYYDAGGNKLYVADYGNNLIRVVTLPSSGAAPVAAIGATATAGKVNDILTFTDQSTNNPTTRIWDISPNDHQFMNGTSSSSASIDVKFLGVKVYTVTLQVSNANGSDIATRNIDISLTSVDDVMNQTWVMLYPNPAAAQFTIELPESGKATQVSVTDLTGKEVYSTSSSEKQITCPTASFGKGLYVVRVLNEGRTSVHKLRVN
jgi:PKD repeat protein